MKLATVIKKMCVHKNWSLICNEFLRTTPPIQINRTYIMIPIQVLLQVLVVVQVLNCTPVKSVVIPSNRSHAYSTEDDNESSNLHSQRTTRDPEVLYFDEIDPKVAPYINKVYNDSDFDKVVKADGDFVTILYDRDYEEENSDPEVKRLLKQIKDSPRQYFTTEVNYFNRSIPKSKLVHKDKKELKFLQKRNQIYKDLIDTAAEEVVQVAFNDVVVEFGNEIHAKDTTKMPTYVSWSAEKDSQYCLIMTDPDTTLHTRVQAREYQLWIVVNIPGNNVAAGETITEYVRPHPEYDSGFHRFMFFVFKQSKKDMIYDEIKLSHIPVRSLRKEFSTKNFAEKNNLTGPVAVNFFIACWDKKVEEDCERDFF